MRGGEGRRRGGAWGGEREKWRSKFDKHKRLHNLVSGEGGQVNWAIMVCFTHKLDILLLLPLLPLCTGAGPEGEHPAAVPSAASALIPHPSPAAQRPCSSLGQTHSLRPSNPQALLPSLYVLRCWTSRAVSGCCAACGCCAGTSALSHCTTFHFRLQAGLSHPLHCCIFSIRAGGRQGQYQGAVPSATTTALLPHPFLTSIRSQQLQ